jgi:hypothetical protein
VPNRILRDGILTSERVDALGLAAEVFYRRLMSAVDDQGRYYAHPSLLRAALYPLRLNRVSDADIEAWLSECGGVGLVRTYQVGGKRYLELLDFRQRVRSPSKFPQPPAADKCAPGAATGPTVARECPSDDGQTAVTCPPNARLDEGVCEDEGEGVCVRANARSCAHTAGDSRDAFEPDAIFRRMWERHPKKRGLHLAQQAFTELLAEAVEREQLAARIEQVHAAWCRAPDWTRENGRYCPQLHRWLADRGYLDGDSPQQVDEVDYPYYKPDWAEKSPEEDR